MKSGPWLVGVVLASCTTLMVSAEIGIAQKANLVWKPIVPNQDSRVLVKRALAGIQKDIAELPNLNRRKEKEVKKRMAKIRCAALALAAVIQCTPALARDRKLATTRDTLLILSSHARAHNMNLVQQLGANLAQIKANPSAQLGPIVMLNALADPEDLMFSMKRLRFGGDGIHPDLQTTRLQEALNGIEEKIKFLGRTKLTGPQMTKEAKELALMARKIAALSLLAEEWSPNIPVGAGLQTRRNWQRWSKDMRDQSIQLANAANQVNEKAVFAAAIKLNNTCTQCHKVFKQD